VTIKSNKNGKKAKFLAHYRPASIPLETKKLIIIKDFLKHKNAYLIRKKILPISLKLNFTPNTLGYYGLTK